MERAQLNGKTRVLSQSSTWVKRRSKDGLVPTFADEAVHANDAADWRAAEATMADVAAAAFFEGQPLCPTCLRPLPQVAASENQHQAPLQQASKPSSGDSNNDGCSQ